MKEYFSHHSFLLQCFWAQSGDYLFICMIQTLPKVSQVLERLLVMQPWVFLMTSYLTHTYGSSALCKDGVIQCNIRLRWSLTKTCIHKSKQSNLILMHSYFVMKLQAVNGNADTCWGKRKFIDDGISWIEPHALTHTSPHTCMHRHSRTRSSVQYTTTRQQILSHSKSRTVSL